MKYWIRLFALIFCIVLIFAVIGSLLPHGYSLEASRTINAPPSAVYQQIESLPKWKAWSQWNPEIVESLSIDYGPDGKSQRWTDVRGEGKLWFTKQKENQRIDYQLRFANFPEMSSSIELKADAADPKKTTVSWSSEGVLPSGPFYGFFRHIFVDGMTVEYETSLQRLAKTVEVATESPGDVEIAASADKDGAQVSENENESTAAATSP